MIYSPSTTAALGIVEDAQPEEPLTLRGEGLWVCLISSGKCVAPLPDLGTRGGRLATIPGQVPALGALPAGGRFAARCPQAVPPWAGCC